MTKMGKEGRDDTKQFRVQPTLLSNTEQQKVYLHRLFSRCCSIDWLKDHLPKLLFKHQVN